MESSMAETTNYPAVGDDKQEETKDGCAGQPPVPQTSVPFSEILHLVQSGQSIPGLQKLNITATEGRPTQSQMARRPKPWEIIQ